MEGSAVCTQCTPPSFSFLPGGVECISAKPGEVYEQVEWPRVALTLVGVVLHEIAGKTLEDLTQTWTDVLTSYTASNYQLHVLQVAHSIVSTTSTQILVAIETKISAGEKSSGKVGNVVKAAESALGALLDELNGSIYGNASQSEERRVLELATSSSFRNDLVRQFDHLKLFDGALTADMVNLSVVDPAFTSTRAVACTPGTYFSLGAEYSTRECLPCAVGSFSASSGSLKCASCPRGTFSALEGRKSAIFAPRGLIRRLELRPAWRARGSPTTARASGPTWSSLCVLALHYCARSAGRFARGAQVTVASESRTKAWRSWRPCELMVALWTKCGTIRW